MGMGYTMKEAREASARLLAVRSQIRALSADEAMLVKYLRITLSTWGPLRTDDEHTVYVAAGSLRRTFSKDRALDVLRSLGATEAQIEACYVQAATEPSVRERKPRPDDR